MRLNLRQWALALGLIGFGFGAMGCTMITTIISTLHAGDGNLYVVSEIFSERIQNPLAAYVLEQVLAGTFVAVEMAASVVYEIESWSILKATLVHFFVCMTVFLPTAFLLGWISPAKPLGVVLMILGCIIGYFLVWLMFYVSYRIEIRKMNEEITRLKSRQ